MVVAVLLLHWAEGGPPHLEAAPALHPLPVVVVVLVVPMQRWVKELVLIVAVLVVPMQ